MWKIIELLKKHPNSYPFLVPVDPVGLNLPDYLEIVTEPIDISTIEEFLNSNPNYTFLEFQDDIR